MMTLLYATVFLFGAAWVIHPLLARPRFAAGGTGGSGPDSHNVALTHEKEDIIAAIRDLDFEHETGKLSDEDHAELRRTYRTRALEIVSRLEAGTPPAEPARTVRTNGQPPLPSFAFFCRQCGTPLESGDRFCATCGAAAHVVVGPADSGNPGGSP